MYIKIKKLEKKKFSIYLGIWNIGSKVFQTLIKLSCDGYCDERMRKRFELGCGHSHHLTVITPVSPTRVELHQLWTQLFVGGSRISFKSVRNTLSSTQQVVNHRSTSVNIQAR